MARKRSRTSTKRQDLGCFVLLIVIALICAPFMGKDKADDQSGPTTAPTTAPTIKATIKPTTQPTAVPEYPVLKKGDTGADVIAMQQLLYDTGYYNSTVDGNFGSGTEKALKAFQAAADMPSTGVCDQATHLLLRSYNAPYIEMVYIGVTGTKYHTEYCHTLNDATYSRIPLSQAEASGRRACQICH
jgi:peptidoglycan hydrolase-like protein with peptidoglycan-binding domain